MAKITINVGKEQLEIIQSEVLKENERLKKRISTLESKIEKLKMQGDLSKETRKNIRDAISSLHSSVQELMQLFEDKNFVEYDEYQLHDR